MIRIVAKKEEKTGGIMIGIVNFTIMKSKDIHIQCPTRDQKNILALIEEIDKALREL